MGDIKRDQLKPLFGRTLNEQCLSQKRHIWWLLQAPTETKCLQAKILNTFFYEDTFQLNAKTNNKIRTPWWWLAGFMCSPL